MPKAAMTMMGQLIKTLVIVEAAEQAHKEGATANELAGYIKKIWDELNYVSILIGQNSDIADPPFITKLLDERGNN